MLTYHILEKCYGPFLRIFLEEAKIFSAQMVDMVKLQNFIKASILDNTMFKFRKIDISFLLES